MKRKTVTEYENGDGAEIWKWKIFLLRTEVRENEFEHHSYPIHTNNAISTSYGNREVLKLGWNFFY